MNKNQKNVKTSLLNNNNVNAVFKQTGMLRTTKNYLIKIKIQTVVTVTLKTTKKFQSFVLKIFIWKLNDFLTTDHLIRNEMVCNRC